MPSSQVLTKRRVKRRQQRQQQRFVSKNAKRKVRSVRKHRKTAKKVMRGGGDSVSIYGFCDKIPLGRRDNIKIPICIVVRQHNIYKDTIYVFFNKNITNEEVMLILKLLLGISMDMDFILEPPLGFEPQDDSSENVEGLPDDIHSKFVKLSGITGYNIETGTIKVDIDNHGLQVLDKLIDKKHKINSGKIVANSGEKVIENFKKSKPEFNTKVLPELYKNYYFLSRVSENGGLQKEPGRNFYEEGPLVIGLGDAYSLNYRDIVQKFLKYNVLNYGNVNYVPKRWWEETNDLSETFERTGNGLELGDERD